MKQLVCMSVIWVMSLTSGWAQEAREGKIPFDVQFGQLAAFLELSPFQWDEVKSINDYFVEMQKKSLSGFPKQKEKQMKTAVYGNLKLMKEALNSEQYRKYVTLLNVTNNSNQVLVADMMPDVYLAEIR